MGLTAFLIRLDNETGIFVSDPVHPTLVTGRVVILTGSTALMGGVLLNFRGEERTWWTEQVGDNLVSHRAENRLFGEKLFMLGGAPAGEYVRSSYPFRVTLPPNMPSSLRVRKGTRVKYTLEAIVVSTDEAQFNTKRDIRVVAQLPKTTTPIMMMPGRYSSEKRFCCLWCRSGPLTLVLSLPARGVVIGKDFAVTVEADNASNVDVLELVAKVKKYTSTYMNRFPESQTVCRFSFGSVPRRTTVTKTLLMPQMSEAPVNVDRCQLINVIYRLEVTACTSRWHENLRVGTIVKFLSSNDWSVNAAHWDSCPLGQWADSEDHRPSAPPPSYEIAIGRTASD